MEPLGHADNLHEKSRRQRLQRKTEFKQKKGMNNNIIDPKKEKKKNPEVNNKNQSPSFPPNKKGMIVIEFQPK